MDNKDFENYNLGDDFNFTNDNNAIDNAKETELDTNDIELSSNENSIFDLNSFAAEDIIEEEEIKTEKEPKNKIEALLQKIKNMFKKKNLGKTVLTLFLVFLLTGCIIISSFAVYAFAIIGGDMENDIIAKQDLDDLALSYTTVIYAKDRNGKWIEHQRVHDGENRIWVEYDRDLAMAYDPNYKGIPQHLANAFVAIEDKHFFEHDGVDWKRTAAAFVNMVVPFSGNKFGGSTITQQLVKNITSDDDKKASRKIREILRARYLEGGYTKEVILECYMNTISMARGMYGVAVPASYYFGKTVDQLTIAECASLASITKSPEYYRPDKNPENNLKRRNTVLYEMYDQGMITKEEYDTAINEELNIVANEDVVKNTLVINDYFVDNLIEEAVTILMDLKGYKREAALADFYSGGYKIYSTLDPVVQSSLNKVFTDAKYAFSGKENTKVQGAMTVLDYEGHVKGIVGGLYEKTENRGLNRATMSPRQPGSTIKPLSAYTPAIENDLITYSTIVDDKKTVYYEGKEYEWFPVNWYKDGYRGKMNIEYALRNSVNTIPVQLVDLLTPQKSYDFIKGNFMLDGLNNPEDINYSPLGMGGTNGGITTYQSAAAFAAFGNGGLYYSPTSILSIYDRFDELVYEDSRTATIAMSEDTATIMNHLLQKVVTASDGTGIKLREHFTGMPVYAKTGTSDDANDLWFVGGTPYYVASCWAGFDSMQEIAKKNDKIALRMWGDAMAMIHKDLAVKNFEDSKYAEPRLYCSATGLLATDACPTGSYGWYKVTGQKFCTEHGGYPIRANTVDAIKEYLDNPTSQAPVEETESENTSSTEE